METRLSYLEELAIKPFDANLRFNFSRYLLSEKEFEAAELHLRWLVQQEPENFNYLECWHSCRWFLGLEKQPLSSAKNRPRKLLRLVMPLASEEAAQNL